MYYTFNYSNPDELHCWLWKTLSCSVSELYSSKIDLLGILSKQLCDNYIPLSWPIVTLGTSSLTTI
jgi:hypothetical protein